jgi:hypothetical protein
MSCPLLPQVYLVERFVEARRVVKSDPNEMVGGTEHGAHHPFAACPHGSTCACRMTCMVL